MVKFEAPPKKPVSAYMSFHNSQKMSEKWNGLSDSEKAEWNHRSKTITSDTTGKKITGFLLFQQSFGLGNKWKSMSPEEKQVYVDVYEQDKAEYAKSYKEYESKHGSPVDIAAQAPAPPKRPLTSYMIFHTKNRKRVQAENPKSNFSEIGKLLGQEWRQHESERDQVFRECEYQAADLKEAYEKEKSAYEAKYGPTSKVKKIKKDITARAKKETTKTREDAKRKDEKEKEKRRAQLLRNREKAKAEAEKKLKKLKQEQEKNKKKKKPAVVKKTKKSK
jgi:HMG (high mobility group) box